MSYLLRVILPDRPGSLGMLALALGEVGADILSLDVVERGVGYAVDDIVVQMPNGALPDTLITAAEALEDTFVDAVRPFTGSLDTHLELALIDAVVAARHDRLQVLADGLPRALQVHWAVVVDGADGATPPLAASSGTPETWPNEALGPHTPAPVALDSEADWLPESWRQGDFQLAAAPLGDSGRILLLGRNGDPQFRPAEIARLGYVSGILATVLK